jgi:hypothetical protein
MAVFSFLPEMKKPEDFKKGVMLMQVSQLIIYSVVGGVLYSYGGQVRLFLPSFSRVFFDSKTDFSSFR